LKLETLEVVLIYTTKEVEVYSRREGIVIIFKVIKQARIFSLSMKKFIQRSSKSSSSKGVIFSIEERLFHLEEDHPRGSSNISSSTIIKAIKVKISSSHVK